MSERPAIPATDMRDGTVTEIPAATLGLKFLPAPDEAALETALAAPHTARPYYVEHPTGRAKRYRAKHRADYTLTTWHWGNELRLARELLGLTGEQISTRSGVSRTSVERVIQGRQRGGGTRNTFHWAAARAIVATLYDAYQSQRSDLTTAYCARLMTALIGRPYDAATTAVKSNSSGNGAAQLSEAAEPDAAQIERSHLRGF